MAAHRKYEALLARVRKPLNEMGFCGDGAAYDLPHERYWALLGFQAEVDADDDRVSVVVNVKVASKTSFAELVHAYPGAAGASGRPDANARYPQVAEWHSTVGRLRQRPLGHPHETPFSVTAETDVKVLADEVVRHVELYALPAMRRRLTGRTRLQAAEWRVTS